MTQTRLLIAKGKSFEAAVREASIGLVRPKIMTAATAILGLLPILLLRLHGAEIERPLAIVMTGGLIKSTLSHFHRLTSRLTYLKASTPATGSPAIQGTLANEHAIHIQAGKQATIAPFKAGKDPTGICCHWHSRNCASRDGCWGA